MWGDCIAPEPVAGDGTQAGSGDTKSTIVKHCPPHFAFHPRGALRGLCTTQSHGTPHICMRMRTMGVVANVPAIGMTARGGGEGRVPATNGQQAANS